MNVFLWYPKCSTCQKALKSLQEKNIELTLRDITKETPSFIEIKEIYEKSGLDIKKFFNTSGLVYKNNHLKEKLDAMTLNQKLEMLSSNGMLIKRPILILANEIIIRYKEENYQKLKEVKNERIN